MKVVKGWIFKKEDERPDSGGSETSFEKNTIKYSIVNSSV